MSAKPPPLVPHMDRFPANFAPSIDMDTAISSSHCKKITRGSAEIISISELAGVIGYAE
jgi:hypothetical protein